MRIEYSKGNRASKKLILFTRQQLESSSSRKIDGSSVKCQDARMLITTGKVQDETIKLDETCLPEGAVVTVLAPEGDETFELAPADEAKLLAAIAEAERGEATSAANLLKQICRV